MTTETTPKYEILRKHSDDENSSVVAGFDRKADARKYCKAMRDDTAKRWETNSMHKTTTWESNNGGIEVWGVKIVSLTAGWQFTVTYGFMIPN